ncbi:MAG: type III-A CRISPR-associated RAMP protein Csm3 [Okeania sp. SIO2H7]|nr:type III-A CRISPR-associated RAMP protein Csm3 [Okeania sp. SIO2H7]
MTVSTVKKPQKKLLGKLKLTSTLVVETGLHIGGGGENLEIGGLDKPIIRDPMTRQPYLPGSSIKGKLRSILERLLEKPVNRPGGSGTYRYESDDLADGVTEVDKNTFIKFEGARTCPVCRVFGSTGVTCWIETGIADSEGLLENNPKKKTIDGKEYTQVTGRNSPARLIVRDCHLLETSAEKLEKSDTTFYMSEWKFENGIDRITAAANPRQVERVPRGAEFHFEIVYAVEDETQVEEDIRNLALALAILEEDALGGHGSRGYGKVSFQQFKIFYRDLNPESLLSGNGGSLSEPIAIKNTDELLQKFGNLLGTFKGTNQEQLPPGNKE